jgi:hypothetical protein
MSPKVYTVTIEVVVTNPLALRALAYSQALSESLTTREWARLRYQTGDPIAQDLLMVFDLRSPYGTEIQHREVA